MLEECSALVKVFCINSSALGQGWRLGFLGLLHMDVFNQRLEQEHGAQVITTTPSVPYKVRQSVTCRVYGIFFIVYLSS